MTDRPSSDDRMQRIGSSDDAEATRQMDEVDDATRPIDPRDDATRRMDEVASTRPITPDEATQMMTPAHVHEPAVTHRLDPITAQTSPRTERIVLPGRSPAIGAWLIATLVAVGLIVGGIFGYTQTEPSDDNVVARALVGAEGGVLTFDQVGRLEVPKDALPTATAITIRREKLDRHVRLGSADDPRSRVYDAGELDVYAFEPGDLRFQRPVKITLPRSGDAEAVLVDSEDGARVIPARGEGTTVQLETTSLSFDGPAG